MKILSPDDFVDMRVLARHAVYEIDLVYADASHPENIFGKALYKKDAGLYLYKDLAHIVLKAADILLKNHGLILVLKDGLRPVEAQQAMLETDIVRANPHWLEDGDNRLLSPPGQGGHPRGMAVDVSLKTPEGNNVDCGTCFDAMVPQSHRDYRDLPETCLRNRAILTDSMMQAADYYNVPLHPLSSEWWDYRYPAELSGRYAPVSDTGLPASMKMLHL